MRYLHRVLSACFSLAAWSYVVFSAFAGVATAQSRDSQSASEQTLQEVTVTARRLHDHHALERAVSGFVTSHSTPAARTNQIGRWHEPVCPLVTGLQPQARDFVTREILDVARGVGAPTEPAGKKCEVTVEIVFTREPQALLDRIAKAYRPLLGFYPVSQVKQMTTFNRPIQAWYETGTRSMDIEMPIPAFNLPFHNSNGPDFSGHLDIRPQGPDGPVSAVPLLGGAQVDSDVTAMGLQPSGVAGSFLGHQVRSEFVHVLIIADSGQLARFPMQSISDYLALLSLTRMAQLDQCAPLPSITDLLANDCPTPVADSLTAADRAYLKALYSADLEKNLSFERGDIHEQMMRQIEGR
jgi:hypothetical protein